MISFAPLEVAQFRLTHFAVQADPFRPNLVDNAIKYSHRASGSPPTVRVVLRRTEEQMEVEVQNVASPITPEDIQNIFEAGYRGRAAWRQSPLGAGLGLYVSKKVLAAQGGSLEIISEPVVEGGRALITTIARLLLEKSVA